MKPNLPKGGVGFFVTISKALWNSQGKQVASQKINVVKGLNKINSSCNSGYPEGYYFTFLPF